MKYLMPKKRARNAALTQQPLVPPTLRRRNKAYVMLWLTVLLMLAILLALNMGSVRLPFATCCQVLISQLPFIDIIPDCPAGFDCENYVDILEILIINTRLPRIILAGLVGAALAVAGATYQGLFRNPLADPYLLGVASGAGLGATIAFMLPVGIAWLVPVAIPLLAFIGGMIAVTAVYFVARVGKTLPPTTLILAGVALSALLSSVTSYLMTTSGEELHGIVFWLLGGLSLTEWTEVQIVLPCVAIGTIVILMYARPLNVMQLNEEQARQLGINVDRVKFTLLIAATLITSAAVCFTGLIGFVGIIIPHVVRLIWGPDHRFLLPLSVLVGAIFLILADTLAHTLLAPHEVPVGVVTAFCGSPFFLYLLRWRKRISFFQEA